MALLIIFHSGYFDELQSALTYIRESPELSLDEKRRFFKSANANLGSFIQSIYSEHIHRPFIGISALCLSGGASFGYCE